MLRFAMIGTGRIGRMHAANLAAHRRAELRWLYDSQPAVAREVAESLGTQAAPDIECLLADPAVDAVLIATPTDSHVELITAAAKAGKAILCEKPIDLDSAKVARCWAEIAPLAPTIMIGFNRRFDPSFMRLGERARAGEIGRLEQLVITSRDPAPPPAGFIASSGGLFRDMTIHDFDMARCLLGPIAEVQASGDVLVEPAIGAAGDIDSAMVLLRAESGAQAVIVNSRRCAFGYDQRIELFGEHGMLQAGNCQATTVSFSGAQGLGTGDPALDFFVTRYREAYRAELDHFIESVLAGEAPAPGFADGQAAMAIAEAALESLASGRRVRLPD